MYHQYFGLKESPFSISVNPRYLFMSPRHRDALAHLLYGVGTGGGFILLTGEVGTGKTTINRALLEQMPETTDLAIVLNPALSAVELLATVCDELEIDYPTGTESLKLLTDALHRFLLANHEAGRKTVLMIDEAQHLDFDVLEQIRLLTNLETDSEKLLQIILIGQPELTEKLARPELRQLNQRITARYNLEPLNLAETAAYIRHRLEVAGLPGGRELFPAGVVKDIHRRTRGIPRQINLLCDRTLLGAYGRQQSRINRSLVGAAASEVFGTGTSEQRPAIIVASLIILVFLLALGLAAALGVFDSKVVPVRGAELAPAPTSAAEVTPLNQPSKARKSNWLLSTAEAERWLWQLNSDAPQPPALCPSTDASSVKCSEARADIWDPLLQLGRPVILDMQTPDRFSAATVVVAFQDRAAWVIAADGLELVLLVDLADAWRGGYRYLWNPPVDWERPIALGDRGPGVVSVANLFAVLDGQQDPLSNDVFNDALATRVMLFQRGQGINDDGVVGEQTLLRLNDALGVGLIADRALARAQLLLESR